MARNASLLLLSIASLGCFAGKHGVQPTFDEVVRRGSKIFQKDLQSLDTVFSGITARINQQWGERDAKLSDRTVFVKYSQSFHTRVIADYDHGTVTVETMDDKDPQGSLRKAIVATLLTTNDPRSVDLFSDSAVAVRPGGKPYLLGLVLDDDGKPIRTREQAERFAASLVASRCRTHTIDGDGGPRTARSVKIAMVANFTNRSAERYRLAVAKYAEQYKVSPSLVFAIIRAESNFNPFAVSWVPAFGLMQLVPRTGGRDAYRRAKGIDSEPTSEYLFDAENNIELGTAYLSLLAAGQLAQVKDPVAREYCVIAAYNTGAGNVLRAFASDRKAALAAINGLGAQGVYDKLRTSLPNPETGTYLAKVVGYRKQFLSLTGERADLVALQR
jgi:membrane-bound lytic murein transglycosylase C